MMMGRGGGGGGGIVFWGAGAWVGRRVDNSEAEMNSL